MIQLSTLRQQPMPHPVRTIAIFRALNLGDLLLAVPAFRALRAGFPAAEIALISLPWAESFVTRYARYLDRFVEFEGFPGIDEVPQDAARIARFLAEQRASGYDLVIQMHGSGLTSTPFALALHGRTTAGYYEGAFPHGLDIGARYPADEPEIRRNLRLAGMLGCPTHDTRLEFPLDDEDRFAAAALLGRRRRVRVGLHPGARPPARRWPAEYFAAVGNHFAREYDAQIVLTGGPGEEGTVRAVAERLATKPLNLAGHTSLGSLAAVIARLDLFISNDTGPAHLACAVGTPSVTIFGPADYVRWMPLDTRRHPSVRHPVPCSPCAYWECPIDHRCLRRLHPEVVVARGDKLLASFLRRDGPLCPSALSAGLDRNAPDGDAYAR